MKENAERDCRQRHADEIKEQRTSVVLNGVLDNDEGCSPDERNQY